VASRQAGAGAGGLKSFASGDDLQAVDAGTGKNSIFPISFTLFTPFRMIEKQVWRQLPGLRLHLEKYYDINLVARFFLEVFINLFWERI
jgi:hypothetical protein